MDSSRIEIGKRLKKARLKRDLTQDNVATKAGLNTNYYACIERGEVNASLEKLHNIIKVLRVKSSDILPY
ncbi:hypothetical protein A3H80_01210 [Candidatus Roizmanbacteria bacterium RIFCSPLOWO2_02_FULL_37_19]|uniref:HTH cro/C1-type domain-containing protein n=1 Tax=Candidatus Roizmanbacteria bacterium RIFCSPHIGHO2_02_FULL_37_24 TaxID=1802037 RepID=A0A1F7GVE9_9BACT|nr:MAG: hypothetical protein A2862_00590 [Candidatus Roizmanbacteria bacterium RIFCSPHIGHO2_01_FULL_38_41]OGK22556.1 MAG: hypothetical protein A3C24_05330 [Candidatus Roizmanbacteria bacterium RIFCSPHIGHO2_02_FULL_37_24]OGK32721.1 MAG: hypothetical protein A3E10_00355 [Candidatus Roizmanbacteria bacterium RIFCSPHIGHO2_12_FULL_37_23]OGK45266.1 MAG: hypothetical protein A2956_01910 [Candidatus Roizmanbacteria bacterium RIFCSPLOWO2_01_FULL_37_57]OGK54219.1 MAG: hypothetical protein A3H80_01210 [Ca